MRAAEPAQATRKLLELNGLGLTDGGAKFTAYTLAVQSHRPAGHSRPAGSRRTLLPLRTARPRTSVGKAKASDPGIKKHPGLECVQVR